MKKTIFKTFVISLFTLALLFLITYAAALIADIAFLPLFTTGIGVLSFVICTVLVCRLRDSHFLLKRYKDILGNLPIDIAVTDQAGRILWQHCEKGDSDYNAVLKNISNIAASDEVREILRSDVRNTFRTGTGNSRTIAALRRRFFFHRIPNVTFGCETVLLASVDVSPLFVAKAKLEKLERRYSALFNGILVGAMRLDCDGRILEINDSGSRLLGQDSAEMVGLECHRVIHPSLPNESFEELLAQIAKTGGQREFSKSVSMAIGHGGEIPVYLKIESVDNVDGTPEEVMLFFRDHTLRAKKERELSENKWNFSLSMNLCRASYFKYNPRTYEAQFDESRESQWPLKNGYLLPEQEWVHHDDLGHFTEGRERLLAGKEKLWNCIYRSNYSGHTIWYYLNAMLVSDNNGEPQVTGTIQNISGLRETILQNDENAFILHLILKALPCVFFIKDVTDDYRYVVYSEKGYEIFGLSPERVIGKNDFEVFGATAVAKEFRRQDIATNDAKTVVDGYADISDHDGNIRHFHVMEVAYPTKDGRKLLFGVSFDVTEEQETQKKLLHLQEFYRELLDHLPVSVLVKDADNDFRYVIWNRLLEQHTGYAAEQVIGKTDFEIEPYPGQQQLFRDLDLESMKSGNLMQLEQSLTTAIGKKIDYRTFKMALRNGKKNYSIETCLDVSREKKLEMEQQNTISRLNEQIALTSIVNTCLRRLNREPSFDQAVNTMLQIIGIGIGVDRCCIYWYSDDRQTVNCAFEWVRDGMPARKLRSLDSHILLPQWDAILANRQVIKVNGVGSLPPDQREAGRKFMGIESIHSMVCCGLFSGNDLGGWIALDSVSGKHEFSDRDVHLLNDAISIYQLARQRKLINDRIEEGAALQKMIIDTITIPVVLLKPDFTITHANPSALKMMGISAKDISGHPCNNLICHCENPPEGCSIRKILSEHKNVTTLSMVNGISYTINASPILHHGRVVQVLESFIDMTEFNKSQEILRKTARDAEAAAKAKSLFLSTMSHELRTPLNAVIGFSELLQLEGMSEAEKLDALKSIQLSGSVLLQLINDVLDLSKLESGQMKISLMPTDLRRILEEMRCIFLQKFKDSNLSFLAEIPETLPLLYLDEPHIRQILLNIIGNAVKFTSHGGVTVSVQFQSGDAGTGDLAIQIRDTGIGISPDYIDKVFEPFVQQDSERGLMHKGTGLGLPICKRLVEQMNGTLKLQSILGRGSCFTVQIPHVRIETAPRVSPKEAAPANVLPAVQLRILLVDDVEMNLKVLTTMVRKLGAQTASAESGEAALDAIPAFHPDLILSDLWMPGMNGDELARRIKLNPAWKDIPIVAVTADAEFGQEQNSKIFQGILTKPITMERLRTVLQGFCKQENENE